MGGSLRVWSTNVVVSENSVCDVVTDMTVGTTTNVVVVVLNKCPL